LFRLFITFNKQQQIMGTVLDRPTKSEQEIARNL